MFHVCAIYSLRIILLVNNIRVRNFRRFGWNENFLTTEISRITVYMHSGGTLIYVTSRVQSIIHTQYMMYTMCEVSNSMSTIIVRHCLGGFYVI